MFIEPDHTERENSEGAKCLFDRDTLRSSGAKALSPHVLYKHLAALRPGLDVLLEIRRQDTSRSFSLFHHANCQRDE